jgi:hypothetical protein
MLAVTMLLLSVTILDHLRYRPPPPTSALLPETVFPLSTALPLSRYSPPPCWDVLEVMVFPSNVASLSDRTTPPPEREEALPEMVFLLSVVTLPSLRYNPPPLLPEIVFPSSVVLLCHSHSPPPATRAVLDVLASATVHLVHLLLGVCSYVSGEHPITIL